jgi:hypothetical protein
MPYIPMDDAYRILNTVDFEKLMSEIKTSGEFNFLISYLTRCRINMLGQSYENLKSVYGDLKLVADEFRVRKIEPYEDYKRQLGTSIDPYDDSTSVFRQDFIDEYMNIKRRNRNN